MEGKTSRKVAKEGCWDALRLCARLFSAWRVRGMGARKEFASVESGDGAGRIETLMLLIYQTRVSSTPAALCLGDVKG
jgi:hypothetical protein